MTRTPAPDPRAAPPARRPAPPRLLDQVRQHCRLRHFSPRTEDAYLHWIRHFIVFHGKRHPATLTAADVTAFLSALATRGVSASTQNQALSALLFLYRHVLHHDLGQVPPPVRAQTPTRLPVVLSRDEVRAVLGHLTGVPRLVASLLYGAGLRLTECLELRAKDIDFDRAHTTMIYTHVLARGVLGVRSPADRL